MLTNTLWQQIGLTRIGKRVARVFCIVSSELISTLKGLSRSDKCYVLQLLISELAQNETDLIKPDQAYPVWSPYGVDEAADTMLKVLQAVKAQDHA